ncbi:glycosyltransferase [Candidatus Pelagibacter sp.]|uniref:glycosyltransferase n=1 Tax=Candidatus Pelagibacter sp. TaxID=2024849 RepID=UPI003F83FBD8
MIKSLSVIFPLYNEQHRLSKLFSEIKKQKYFKKENAEFIFVNDGSNDKSLQMIKDFKSKNKKKINIKIISYNKNQGKGFALKKGIFLAKRNWILTMDIDLSVKFNQLKIWENKKYLNKNIEVYFGSRLLLNSKVNAKEYRKITGNIFNLILSFIFNREKLKIKDTQCGFKLYKNKIAKKIFLKSRENGYINDVEILLLLLRHKIKLSELPVIWSHKDGSKVNILIDSLVMLYHLIKLKLKFNKFLVSV